MSTVMAQEMSCPSCEETDQLRGEAADGDIRITCGSCGAQWMRGAPRCAGCGGTGIVARPQAMTRHSRGTQLSIIGWRELPLCRLCDGRALRTSLEENIPVPADYVAVCLYGTGDPTATGPAPAADIPALEPDAPRTLSAPSASRPVCGAGGPTAQGERDAGAGTGRTAASTGPARTKDADANSTLRSRRKPEPAAVPTVRQAIAAFLTDASGDVDHTALLLLGTHLGSYNRLSTLDGPDTAQNLSAWFDSRWEDRTNPAAQRAIDTLRRAVDFWGARGWLTTDPAAGLR
ncbi:hypothetical protein ACHZ98_33860 [Streptomyces sp. MAR4 CNY-716]